jgi:hypothetical protein
VGAALVELQPRADHQIAQRARYPDLVRSGQRAHPRTNVHADPTDIVAAHLALAGVQPGAHLYTRRLHRITDRHRSADRPVAARRGECAGPKLTNLTKVV